MISIRPISEIQFTVVFQNIKTLVQRGLVDPELGTISKQAQLLTEHCMKLTPPKGVGQGKKRVQLDVEKIFHPVDPDQFKSDGVAKLVRRSDAVAWAAFSANLKGGPLAGTTAVTPTPDLHAANRDRRGRAKRTNMVTLWKQRGAMRDIIARAQDNVGWARAAWLKAYTALRGTRIPAWIGRHGTARGIFIDARNGPRPYVQVGNDSGWGANRDRSDAVVEDALRARTRAMETYFNTTMRLASEGKPTAWQAQMASVAAAQDVAA